LDKVRSGIPSWRWFARRHAFRAAALNANIVLSPEESRLLKRYDQKSTGWAILIVGSLASVVGAFSH
jgi:hypothetical protein